MTGANRESRDRRGRAARPPARAEGAANSGPQGIVALQRAAGNAAVTGALASVQRASEVAVQRVPKVANDGKISEELHKFTLPLGTKSLGGYAALELALEADVTYEASPPAAGATQGAAVTHPLLPQPPAGGGGVKPAAGATTKDIEGEIGYEFQKQTTQWFGDFVPAVKLAGKFGSDGSSSLGVSGSFGTEVVDLKFGFTFVEAKEGKVEFAALSASGALKPFSFSYTSTYGAAKVSSTPVLKATLKPDYPKLARWALEEAAKRVGTEAGATAAAEIGLVVSVVGGAVLVGLDMIDIERRETLIRQLSGKAGQIIDAEGVFLAAIAGRPNGPAPRNEVEKQAQAAGQEVRKRLAARTEVDERLFPGFDRSLFDVYSFEVQLLTELERQTHAGLDNWAKAHPFRSLWGTRMVEDKQRVTAFVDRVLADPYAFRHGSVGR
jgi:hypothetical protein